MAKKESKVKSAAAELGTLGGKARAKKLSKERLREIAAMGGKATKGIPKSKKGDR